MLLVIQIVVAVGIIRKALGGITVMSFTVRRDNVYHYIFVCISVSVKQ